MSGQAGRPVRSSKLGDALVAAADHQYRQYLGGNADREKLRWLASIVASAKPELAREIVIRWGDAGEVA